MYHNCCASKTIKNSKPLFRIYQEPFNSKLRSNIHFWWAILDLLENFDRVYMYIHFTGYRHLLTISWISFIMKFCLARTTQLFNRLLKNLKSESFSPNFPPLNMWKIHNNTFIFMGKININWAPTIFSHKY